MIHTASFIPPKKRTKIRATEARYKMAKEDDWQSLVPKEVAGYLQGNGLVDRFKQEFRKETIASVEDGLNYTVTETAEEEHAHAMEA